MKLEDIQAESEKDLLINKADLTAASIDTPVLVNKYYKILIEEARRLKMYEMDQYTIAKNKFDYYMHLAPPEVYANKPFNRKILKSDVDMYINSDAEYQNHVNKIEMQKYKVKFVEEIIRQLNNRTYLIKNIIEHEKFKNGGF